MVCFIVIADVTTSPTFGSAAAAIRKLQPLPERRWEWWGCGRGGGAGGGIRGGGGGGGVVRSWQPVAERQTELHMY